MTTNEEVLTEQQIIGTYKAMRAEIRQMAEKIAELEVETSEHDRVIQTLKNLPPTRKAYRMVGGILVERTVQEVLPAVSSNRDGIGQVLKQLSENIKQKEVGANDWQVIITFILIGFHDSRLTITLAQI
jgi:prefoldin subunit 2